MVLAASLRADGQQEQQDQRQQQDHFLAHQDPSSAGKPLGLPLFLLQQALLCLLGLLHLAVLLA